MFASSGSTFPAGPWPATPLKDAEQEGLKYMQKLTMNSLAELRALPYEKLVEASIMDEAIKDYQEWVNIILHRCGKNTVRPMILSKPIIIIN